MAIDLTVAIPTYNGAPRLALVLEHLRAQTGTETLDWEILVVDNNSSDDTAERVRQCQADWLLQVPLKYYFEPQQGAAYARQRAVQEAEGNWVAFLDDDVLPMADWVENAIAFGRAHPHAGAYSGQIHAKFDEPPPPEFKYIKAFLAVREEGNVAHRYQPERLNTPPAAALVVRRQAWLDWMPPEPYLAGRVGESMVGGEDIEISMHLHHGGWEVWYCPEMHVSHHIPPHRLERDYLMGLAQGCGLSACQLQLLNKPLWQKPLVTGRILLGSTRRVLFHYWRYRRELGTDLVAAFRLRFYLGNLMSVRYALHHKFWR
ncbi:MAG: hormogonium polysaccharide biosynthesis glycosyltransferase HpsE [Cyanobacteria bacterium J06659_2]